MTLSRWRRVATGVAAGVIVLCAALLGASFRDDTAGVAVAGDLRPANVIPIEDDPVESADVADAGDAESVQVAETDVEPEPGTADGTADDTADRTADDETGSDETDADPAAGQDPATDDGATDPVQVIETDDPADAPAEDPAADDAPAQDTAVEDPATDDAAPEDTADEATDEPPAPEATAEPAAPLTAASGDLGTGGGVDDAECALDRLVIYAGARVGGVAGSIRSALAQAGFAASCPAPVTVLASNCPLQFAGVLGANSGYDPLTPFVASSTSVDRETMSAVMGAVGYTGNEINILDFGFVNPDKPGEQWMAIFIPPSFAGWEDLASRAGLSPSTNSLCAVSGELAG